MCLLPQPENVKKFAWIQCYSFKSEKASETAHSLMTTVRVRLCGTAVEQMGIH